MEDKKEIVTEQKNKQKKKFFEDKWLLNYFMGAFNYKGTLKQGEFLLCVLISSIIRSLMAMILEHSSILSLSIFAAVLGIYLLLCEFAAVYRRLNDITKSLAQKIITLALYIGAWWFGDSEVMMSLIFLYLIIRPSKSEQQAQMDNTNISVVNED